MAGRTTIPALHGIDVLPLVGEPGTAVVRVVSEQASPVDYIIGLADLAGVAQQMLVKAKGLDTKANHIGEID